MTITPFPHPTRQERKLRCLKKDATTTKQIKKWEITKEQILSIANDPENGFLEDKYSEIVKTSDTEYKTLMEKVVEDMGKHKEKIFRRSRNST